MHDYDPGGSDKEKGLTIDQNRLKQYRPIQYRLIRTMYKDKASARSPSILPENIFPMANSPNFYTRW